MLNEKPGAHSRPFFYVETNHEAGRERRAADVGGEPRRNCSLLCARLESTLVLRVMRAVLPHQSSWQRLLVPSGNLGVEFPDPAHGLAEQF